MNEDNVSTFSDKSSVPPMRQNKWQRFQKQCFSPWYKKISVEPTMFLYMFAFMITSVVEQDFFVQKACRVNNNFTAEICKNIKLEENAVYRKQVQVTTAMFHQWESIAGHVFPIVLALFLGSFSDRRGRKFPLIVGLCGKLLYSLMIILNAKMTHWPLEYVIYTATIPTALTGSDLAIFASCFAYISDISTLKNRTMRVTILDVCYLSAMPTGVALGSYLFYNVLKQSYANMFIVNVSLMVISIIYTIFVLEWQTTSKQRPLSELGCCEIWSDFFDVQHVKDSFAVLVKKRVGHRRSFLILLLVAMALYTFQRDENQYLYLYTTFKFNWSLDVYSTFKTFKSSAYVVGVLLAVPLMNKCFHWRDTIIIFIGAWAHTIGRLFYYFASTGQMFYIGALFCSVGPVVGPMIRAITSKIVSLSERGKVFALLAVCDNAVPFISGVCYSQVYRASLDANGKGIFLLTIATQLTVFLLIFCIHLILGDSTIEVPEITEKETDLIRNAKNSKDNDIVTVDVLNENRQN